jgi:hypothetical protein
MLMQNEYNEVLKRLSRLLNSLTLIHLDGTCDALHRRIDTSN